MVHEYTLQYERLSHFISHWIDTPEKKNQKFVMRLNAAIQGSVVGSLDKLFESVVGLARTWEIMREMSQ